jgi:hypothetical protein
VTITLHLKPEVEAGLLAQARASGMRLEEYLLSLAEEAALQAASSATPLAAPRAREEAVGRALDFGEKHHLSLGEPITRKLLHDGHRF